MQAESAQQRIYEGESGYVTVDLVEHAGCKGAVFFYTNPDPRKLHAVDSTGMKEMYAGVSAIEERADDLAFAVFHGAYDQVHAGADITEFAGEPDYEAIAAHLNLGTELDTRIKALWPRLRTVGVFCGDRYGGSVEWPMFAEWGICDSATRIQFSEVHLGIVPGWNGVLNTMLKAGGFNALYMGCTGNPVSSGRMLATGLVQSIVDVPAAPDRREIAREDWQAAWTEHAKVCQQLLVEAALDFAASQIEPQRVEGENLVSDVEFKAELARRMNTAPYTELRNRVAAQAAAVDPEAKDELKALGRKATKELAALDKPLAPEAVAAVGQFIADYGALPADEVLARYDEIGHVEAKQCSDLMHTEHRRRGIDAVLARNPEAKIPVFD